jgi:hypothetical protein
MSCRRHVCPIARIPGWIRGRSVRLYLIETDRTSTLDAPTLNPVTPARHRDWTDERGLNVKAPALVDAVWFFHPNVGLGLGAQRTAIPRSLGATGLSLEELRVTARYRWP